MRSAVIMSQSPFPSTTPLNATRRALGDWRLIRLAAVSTKMGRNTPLLCVIVTVNTTLSGGGQPPPPRKPAGLVDYVACDRFPPCLADNKRGV